VPVRARPLGRFAVERPPRFADRLLDERPVERLLVAVAERDLEELDDVRRRWDDLV
jgi:hypothetical protein